jgi:hypothetical protein
MPAQKPKPPKFPKISELHKTHPTRFMTVGEGLIIRSHQRPSTKFKGNVEQVNVLHDPGTGREVAVITHRSNGSVDMWVHEDAGGQLEYAKDERGAPKVIKPGGYARYGLKNGVIYRRKIDVVRPIADLEKREGGGIRFDFLRYADPKKTAKPRGPEEYYKGMGYSYAWHPK